MLKIDSQIYNSTEKDGNFLGSIIIWVYHRSLKFTYFMNRLKIVVMVRIVPLERTDVNFVNLSILLQLFLSLVVETMSG